jgi:hypothetical protein
MEDIMTIRGAAPGGLIGLIVACGIGCYAFCSGGLTDPGLPPASAGSRDTNPMRLVDIMPPEERAFIAIVHDSAAAYRAKQDEATRAKRAKDICAILAPARPVVGWIGRIVKLTPTSDGKSELGFVIGQDIHIKTWDSRLSDASDKTLIAPDDPLFAAATAFKERRLARFSGEFIGSDVDCVRVANPTLEDSMIQPEFIFRFTDVFGL